MICYDIVCMYMYIYLCNILSNQSTILWMTTLLQCAHVMEVPFSAQILQSYIDFEWAE